MKKDLNKVSKRFTCTYEDNPGGKYVRCVGDGQYHWIEWTDMDDACGRDNEGHPRYVVELTLVDLNTIGPQDIKNALDSCGWEGMTGNPAMIAECVHSYGNRAPLWDDSSNNLSKLMTAARQKSRALDDDPDLMDECMNRPVNAIGSTATEFMKGDFQSAMIRGVMADRTDAKIMAKMYGASDEDIQKLADLGRYIDEQEKRYSDND